MTLFHINIKKDKRSVWFQITVDLVTFNKVCLMSSVWMGEKQGIWLRTMVKGMVICFFLKVWHFFFVTEVSKLSPLFVNMILGEKRNKLFRMLNMLGPWNF